MYNYYLLAFQYVYSLIRYCWTVGGIVLCHLLTATQYDVRLHYLGIWLSYCVFIILRYPTCNKSTLWPLKMISCRWIFWIFMNIFSHLHTTSPFGPNWCKCVNANDLWLYFVSWLTINNRQIFHPSLLLHLMHQLFISSLGIFSFTKQSRSTNYVFLIVSES